ASREKLATAVDMQCEVMAQQEVFEPEGGNKDEDKGSSKQEAPKEGIHYTLESGGGVLIDSDTQATCVKSHHQRRRSAVYFSMYRPPSYDYTQAREYEESD
ncbi:hypothetical protein FOZ62_002038, partial [Perkinsus olseni]